MNSNSNWHGTTIILIRKGKDVVVAGDGQVSIGTVSYTHLRAHET